MSILKTVKFVSEDFLCIILLNHKLSFVEPHTYYCRHSDIETKNAYSPVPEMNQHGFGNKILCFGKKVRTGNISHCYAYIWPSNTCL